jgi:hypothetical protein
MTNTQDFYLMKILDYLNRIFVCAHTYTIVNKSLIDDGFTFFANPQQ